MPDAASKRATLFVTMILTSAVQVLIKGIFVAVLGSVAMNYAMIYLGGEMLFYLGVKFVRGDFRYWVPVPGAAGFAISLIARVVVKFVVDFTCCMQLRHPKEVGGLYFTMNIFSPLIGLTLLLYI